MSDKPVVVVDTQLLLDWLVFRDPRSQAWGESLRLGHWRWLVCSAMRDEFAHMVWHPSLAKWAPDRERALADFDACAQVVAAPRSAGPSLRCRDADDQVFLDLALEHRARWLWTRDKALLALARKTRAQGTEICAPWR